MLDNPVQQSLANDVLETALHIAILLIANSLQST